MREAIDAPQKLFEMPYLSDTDLDFGLGTNEGNAARLAQLLKDDPQVVWERGKDCLYHVGTWNAGSYFLVYDGRQVHYFVEYEQQSLPQLSSFVTQVKLWRAIAIHYDSVSITNEVFEMLLNTFETVVSDEVQTQNGRVFWFRQLAKAVRRGFTIGMIDETGQTSICPDFEAFNKWMSDPPQNTAWGASLTHRKRRFFITSKSV